MSLYLGVDVGSVSTDFAVIDDNINVVAQAYLPTAGAPIKAIQKGLKLIREELGEVQFKSIGATGSGRYLASVVLGADIVKNEITAHAVSALHFVPGVQTVIEIGGQDSKIIILRDGIPVDFAMNTVCAAGTGSFLDHQAARLGIQIEQFSELALKSKNPTRIAGRCTVFAESDMVHKQQIGHNIEDIIAGLCYSLVRNYLANVAKGKEILPEVVFQGGVAANKGMQRAFEDILGMPVIVPKYHKIMGAIGAAILAKEYSFSNGKQSHFKAVSYTHLTLPTKA